MDRPFLMAIVVAVLLLLLLMMLIGWRRRQKAQAGFPRPLGVPADPGAELLVAPAFYVATTVASEPLNRIAVAGLGYRARAEVSVMERGLILAIPGQDAIFIPADDIRSVQRATWTIDRVVESDGLVLVRWTLGEPGTTLTEVDSYLRVIDPEIAESFFAAVHRLSGDTTPTDKTGPTDRTGGHAT